MTIQTVYRRLSRAIRDAGSIANFVRASGISNGHVHDILSRRRLPGPRLLKVLDMERVTVYRRLATTKKGT